MRNAAAQSGASGEASGAAGLVRDGASAAGTARAAEARRLWAYAWQGASSVLQQGLFAGANFAVNILLARWLAPAAYGAFALAYAVFLLLLLVYCALFFEPVMVYGAGRYARRFPSYVRALVRAHFILLVPVTLGIATVVPALARLYSPQSVSALAAAILFSPLLLLVWLCRGAYYAQFRPHDGTVAGLCYLLLLVSAIETLHFYGALSPVSALGGMAAGSGLVGAFFLYRLGRGKQRAAGTAVSMKQAAADHWRYGRWATLAGLANWVPANLFYLVLPLRFGLPSVAALRALLNLMMPLLQSVSALVILLIPVLVRRRQTAGLESVKRNVGRAILWLLPGGALYLVALTASGARILHWLYAGHYGDVSPWSFLLIGILPISGGAIGLLSAALRAFEAPRLVFRGYLASALVAVAVGVPLTLRYGVPGAAGALVLNDLPAIAVMAACLIRYRDPAPAMGAAA